MNWIPHAIGTLSHHPVTTGLICGGGGGFIAIQIVLTLDPMHGWQRLTGNAQPGFWRQFWIHFRWMMIGAIIGVVAVGMTFVPAWLTGLIAGAAGPPAATRLVPDLAEWIHQRRTTERQAVTQDHAREPRTADRRTTP